MSGNAIRNSDGTYTDSEGHTIMADENGEPIMPQDAPEFYDWYKPEKSLTDIVEEKIKPFAEALEDLKYKFSPTSTAATGVDGLTKQDNGYVLDYDEYNIPRRYDALSGMHPYDIPRWNEFQDAINSSFSKIPYKDVTDLLDGLNTSTQLVRTSLLPVIAIGAIGTENLFKFETSGEVTNLIQGSSKAEEVAVKLKYKEGWTAEQKMAADSKIEALNNSQAFKTIPERSNVSASVRYKKAYGADSVPEGFDIDHKLDLQLGGKDDISNMWPLDSSVNRSLGKQIDIQINKLPDGTPIKWFDISD